MVLEQAGGTVTGEHAAHGDGWWASLHPLPPAQIGSIHNIQRDMLVIEGNDARIVTPVYDFVRVNMIRGGG